MFTRLAPMLNVRDLPAERAFYDPPVAGQRAALGSAQVALLLPGAEAAGAPRGG